MVVNDFDIRWTESTARPFETDTPLSINSNAELAAAVSLERFKPIALQRPEVFQALRSLKNLQPSIGLIPEALEFTDMVPGGKRRRSIIPIALDHRNTFDNAMYDIRQA
jgi:hypothetical protein